MHELFYLTVDWVSLGSILWIIDAAGLTTPKFKWAAGVVAKDAAPAGGLVATKDIRREL